MTDKQIVLRAAELIDNEVWDFCCSAIDHAYPKHVHMSPLRIKFNKFYDPDGKMPGYMSWMPSGSENKEGRVLALLLFLEALDDQ